MVKQPGEKNLAAVRPAKQTVGFNYARGVVNSITR